MIIESLTEEERQQLNAAVQIMQSIPSESGAEMDARCLRHVHVAKLIKQTREQEKISS